MKEKDSLQGFIFEHANIRGQIANLNETYRTIIDQRAYPPMLQHLLGEALLSCLLLSGNIKFEGLLSLQFQGDKRLPLLIVQCDHNYQLRAFASFEEHLATHEYAEAFLQGKMSFTISQDNQTSSYQSIVPLQSTSMSENLMHYFAQSEQIATRVWLAIGDNEATGILLQLMPDKEGQESLQREQFWEYAIVLGETLSEQELLTLDNQTILHRLYHETELRLFDSHRASFHCRCSEAKMKQVLSVLGQAETEQLLAEKGKIEMSCDFCNSQFQFDAIDIHLLFRQP